MKKMASPSTVGVAVATARVDPGAIATTMTVMRVAATMVYLVQISSHCLHRQMIIVKRTRGLSRAMRLRRLPPGWSSSSFI
jgi:hypothetical protein